MLSPKEILVTLEGSFPRELEPGDAIENVSWTPEVEIRGCKVMRIPTRGFLCTTRRPVLIEHNEFHATHMSAILVDADTRARVEKPAAGSLSSR